MSRLRTSLRTSPDLSRLSAGLARPGIDTRVWCSLAYASAESILDSTHGTFVLVTLVPTGEEITARVPQSYAGSGFGVHEGTIHKHDELVVLIPLGDPAEGAIVIARLWSAADPPPALAASNTKDYVRQQEENTAIRIKLTGEEGVAALQAEADVTLETTKKCTITAETVTLATDKVRLGSENAGQQVLFGTKYRDKQQTLHQDLITDLTSAATQISSAATALTPAGVALSAGGPLVLLPPGGVQVAAAGAAITATIPFLTGAATQVMNAVSRITAFESAAAPDNYLSDVSKTG